MSMSKLSGICGVLLYHIKWLFLGHLAWEFSRYFVCADNWYQNVQRMKNITQLIQSTKGLDYGKMVYFQPRYFQAFEANKDLKIYLQKIV